MTLSAGACDRCDGDTPTVGQSTVMVGDDSTSAAAADAAHNDGNKQLDK